MTAYEGDNVKLTCQSKRVPVWYYEHEKISIYSNKITHPSYNQLVLVRVEKSREGLYSCKGTSEVNFRFNAEMYLHILGM